MTEKVGDDDLPNVRDGLNRKERIILDCLAQIQREIGSRNVSTSMLYGRVLEYIDISVIEMQSILQRFSGNKRDHQK